MLIWLRKKNGSETPVCKLTRKGSRAAWTTGETYRNFFANCKYSPNNFFLIINFSLTQKLFFQVPIHTRQVFWGRSTTGLVRFIAKPVEIALSLLHGVCFLDLFDKSLVKVLKLSLGSLCVGPLKLILTIIF